MLSKIINELSTESSGAKNNIKEFCSRLTDLTVATTMEVKQEQKIEKKLNEISNVLNIAQTQSLKDTKANNHHILEAELRTLKEQITQNTQNAAERPHSVEDEKNVLQEDRQKLVRSSSLGRLS